MTVRVTYSIECGFELPGCWGYSTPTHLRPMARESAAREGWTRRRRGGKQIDACPRCAAAVDAQRLKLAEERTGQLPAHLRDAG